MKNNKEDEKKEIKKLKKKVGDLEVALKLKPSKEEKTSLFVSFIITTFLAVIILIFFLWDYSKLVSWMFIALWVWYAYLIWGKKK